MNDNETIADIIAWLRRPREGENAYLTLWRDEIADRFDAAHKREVREAVTDCNQFSDAAKLREALTKILDLTNSLDEGCAVYPVEIRDIAKAALAEPARNCDVGTADDWLARFNVVCERCSGSDCDHRLFKDEEVCDCFARWLQMPYEEGGEK